MALNVVCFARGNRGSRRRRACAAMLQAFGVACDAPAAEDGRSLGPQDGLLCGFLKRMFLGQG